MAFLKLLNDLHMHSRQQVLRQHIKQLSCTRQVLMRLVVCVLRAGNLCL